MDPARGGVGALGARGLIAHHWDCAVRAGAHATAVRNIDDNSTVLIERLKMSQQHRHRKQHSLRGMTLIEIMVVITILGLIAGAVVVAVIPRLEEARRSRAELDIKSIESGLKLYYARKGNYPDTGTGLKALVDM